MNKEPRTSLGKSEDEVLNEISSITEKWATTLNLSVKVVENSVSYLWEDNNKKSEKAIADYLSSTETGIYGGR